MQNSFLAPRSSLSRPADRGPVTREMVQARTRQLAEHAGRIFPHIEQADYERAKRELTGETDSDRQLAMLDAAISASFGSPAAERTTELASALAR